jgi:hypothetical protein
LLKQEPSAQSPWQKTILGLVCVDFAVILFSFFSKLLRKFISEHGKSTLRGRARRFILNHVPMLGQNSGHTSQEDAQHRDRELRLKQILSEFASLSKKKLP